MSAARAAGAADAGPVEAAGEPGAGAAQATGQAVDSERHAEAEDAEDHSAKAAIARYADRDQAAKTIASASLAEHAPAQLGRR